MLSKLFKIAIALILLLIIAIAILLWNINPILESLRPKITKTISQQIKQDVELGSIEAQFFPNVAIKVSDLALKNNKDGASVGSLILDTSLGDLLKGKINVKQIALRGVNLKLSREQDGSLSVGGIALAKSETSASATTGTTKSSSTPAKETTAEVKGEETSLDLEIAQVNANDINIYFTDKAVDPIQELNITDASLEALGLNLQGAGSFSLVASVLGTSTQNLKINGESKSGKTALGLPQAKINLSLQDLNLQKINSLASAYGVKIAGLELSNTVELQISAETSDHGFNVKTNFDATKSNIVLANSFVKSSNLPLKINFEAEPSINFSAEIKTAQLELAGILIDSAASISTTNIESTFLIKELPLADLGTVLPALAALNLSGNLRGQAKTSLELGSTNLPNVDADLSLQNISVSTLSEITGKLKISGASGTNKIALDLDPAKAAGAPFGPSTIRADIAGDSSNLSAIVQSGSIPGTNILKQTLEKVNTIPGVQAALIKYVPERLASLLAKDETAFDKLEINASARNKVVDLSKLILTHSAYEVTGDGTANFDSSLNLLAKLILAKDISSEIALKEPKIKLLFDDGGRITIPISIKKSATGKAIVLPDIGDLAKRALGNTAKEAISRELQKRGGSKIAGPAGALLNNLFK